VQVAEGKTKPIRMSMGIRQGCKRANKERPGYRPRDSFEGGSLGRESFKRKNRLKSVIAARVRSQIRTVSRNRGEEKTHMQAEENIRNGGKGKKLE